MDNLIQEFKLIFDKAPDIAQKYLQTLGIEFSDSWQEQLDIIKEHAFTVAKVTSADKLQKVLESLQVAMDEGKPFYDFRKEMRETISTKINWQTVYRTNMMSAYNSGRFYKQLAASDEFPYWKHNCIIDSRTRPLGRELNGKIYPANHPHWSSYYPPNEYNDRDRITTIAKGDAKNYRIEKEEPGLKPEEGFNINPAKHKWQPDLSKYHPKIRSKIENELKKRRGEKAPAAITK